MKTQNNLKVIQTVSTVQNNFEELRRVCGWFCFGLLAVSFILVCLRLVTPQFTFKGTSVPLGFNLLLFFNKGSTFFIDTDTGNLKFYLQVLTHLLFDISL